MNVMATYTITAQLAIRNQRQWRPKYMSFHSAEIAGCENINAIVASGREWAHTGLSEKGEPVMVQPRQRATETASGIARTFGPSTAAFLAGTGLTAALVLILEAFNGASGPLSKSIPLFLLVPVLVASYLGGSVPGIGTALVALFAWDWFFVHPFSRVTIQSFGDLMALMVFLGVAVLTGQLANGVKAAAGEAAHRASTTEAMYELSVALLASNDVSKTLPPIAEGIRRTFNLDACAVLLPDPESTWKTTTVSGSLPDRYRFESSRAIGSTASWAATHGQAITLDDGASATAAHPQRLRMLPLQVSSRQVGILQILSKPGDTLPEADERLLVTLANGIALALEQHRLASEEREAFLAKESDRLKSVLLSSVSHDLRTPLAGIKAASSSLLQHDVAWSDADREAFLTDIDTEVDRLARLVSNLLDLSRIEAGALKPAKEWEGPSELLTETVDRLRVRISTHQVVLRLQEGLRPAFIDAIEVEQIVVNLVENAVRYAPAETEIVVSARTDTDNGSLVISVTDHGPGVPEHLRDRIFDSFFRGNANRGLPGAGMGLAIVKGFAEAHGGTAAVESAEGCGSRFLVTLPSGNRPDGTTAD
jgi:two-component system sensor histidine kinase KdpD